MDSVNRANANMANIIAEYKQLRELMSGSNIDPTKVQQLFDKVEQQIQSLTDSSSDTQSPDAQATSDVQDDSSASAAPTAYSMDDIPQDVQDNPAGQFNMDDASSMQNFASAMPAMSAAYSMSPDSSTQGVGDQRALNGGSVTDQRADFAMPRSVDGNITVRDHRHPEPTNYYAPSSSSQGTIFTSGTDYDNLNAANQAFNEAKDDALKNPKDPAAQQNLADAAAALQVISKLLMQVTSMYASIAENAISSSRVQPA